MKNMNRSKLKALLEKWPSHTVITSDWLLNHGYTHSNIQRYLSSCWIKNVSSKSGAYVRADETIELEGAIYGLQQQYLDTFYIGSKSALERHGAAHYVALNQFILFLMSTQKKPLPFWFLDFLRNKDINLIYSYQNILPPGLGLTFLDCGEFKIQIASRERAAIEMAHEIEKYYTFDECRLMFENLSTLRPHLVQELLEKCTSIKAKRIFLFLCEQLNLPWFNQINLNTIYLGRGSRQLIKDGLYNSKYKITYPKDLFDHDTVNL